MSNQDRSPRAGRRAKLGRRGATMVEFALYFLLFLGLAIGLMEMGRGIWTFTTLSHAARAGARYAQVYRTVAGSPPADVEQAIRDVVKKNAIGLEVLDSKIDINWEELDLSQDPPVWVDDSANKSAGSTVQVRVRHTFQLVVSPLVLAQDSLDLGSVSRMIVAN